MSEYIERNVVIELLRKYGQGKIKDGENTLDTLEGILSIIWAVKKAPAAGVAPVVRCQECIHWMAEGGAGYKSLGTYRCPCARWSNDDGYTAYTDPDDFCVYGEEKEEEQNDE